MGPRVFIDREKTERLKQLVAALSLVNLTLKKACAWAPRGPRIVLRTGGELYSRVVQAVDADDCRSWLEVRESRSHDGRDHRARGVGFARARALCCLPDTRADLLGNHSPRSWSSFGAAGAQHPLRPFVWRIVHVSDRHALCSLDSLAWGKSREGGGHGLQHLAGRR
jgi:hypothetical protein